MMQGTVFVTTVNWKTKWQEQLHLAYQTLKQVCRLNYLVVHVCTCNENFGGGNLVNHTGKS